MTASAQRAVEPSMEEILASIRRIIADDKSRARIGSAKLVSLPETREEKSLEESAPSIELEKAVRDSGAGPAAEVFTQEIETIFKEGAVPEGASPNAEASPSRETSPSLEASASLEAPSSLEASHPAEVSLETEVSPHSISMQEAIAPIESERDPPAVATVPAEEASARHAPSYALFGEGIDRLRPLPHDAHALSMSAFAAPRREEESQRTEPPPLPADDDAFPTTTPAPAEIGETGTVHAEASASPAPEPQPQFARARAESETPDLSSPSPRLAEACADHRREAARMAGYAGTRSSSRKEDAAAILSSEANRAVARAFGDLNRGVLGDNVRSLEDTVKEMLRPLLKTWLDDNLPQIVERLVRMEIERVARGRPE